MADKARTEGVAAVIPWNSYQLEDNASDGLLSNGDVKVSTGVWHCELRDVCLRELNDKNRKHGRVQKNLKEKVAATARDVSRKPGVHHVR